MSKVKVKLLFKDFLIRALVRDVLLDPAAIFSDVGPDVRWIGNEQGIAGDECFGSFTPHAPRGRQGEAMPGYCETNEATSGHSDGVFFIPGDCDVALRPGWFYHNYEDNALKSVRHLIKIYLSSAGNGAYMNLGIAPDQRGLLHENDVKRLKEFKAAMDSLFANKVFGDEVKLTDNIGTIEFGDTKKLNFVKLAECLSATQGEQVSGYEIDVRKGGQWETVLKGKAIGLKRLKSFPSQECDAIRIRITQSAAPVAKLKFSGYFAPSDLIGKEIPIQINDIRKHPNYRRLNATPGRQAELWLPGRLKLESFIFTPTANSPAGTPDRCEIDIFRDNNWEKVAEAEFSNIRANAIPQRIPLNGVETNRIRLRFTRLLDEAQDVTFSELGVVTQ